MRAAFRILLSVFSYTACSRPPAPSEAPIDAARVVAQVGERIISVTDVEQQLQAQPDFVRARYASASGRKELVDSLVRSELLMQEARRRGVDKSPEVSALFEKLVIQQLVSEVAKASQPTEAEAKAYFDSHPEEFSRPERVRVALLECGAADAAATSRDLAKVRTAKEPERTKLFNALVAARSTHEASRAQDGDLGPRTAQELTQLFSAEVAAAAFGLQTPGEVSAPVSTPRGQVVLRLMGRQPEERKTFEAEKGALLGRLAAERRLKGVDELVANLRKSAKVVINDKAIEGLNIKPPSGPLLGAP